MWQPYYHLVNTMSVVLRSIVSRGPRHVNGLIAWGGVRNTPTPSCWYTEIKYGICFNITRMPRWWCGMCTSTIHALGVAVGGDIYLIEMNKQSWQQVLVKACCKSSCLVNSYIMSLPTITVGSTFLSTHLDTRHAFDGTPRIIKVSHLD